jgi:hypothetical protein
MGKKEFRNGRLDSRPQAFIIYHCRLGERKHIAVGILTHSRPVLTSLTLVSRFLTHITRTHPTQKLTLKLREASTKKIKESLRKQRADLDAQEDALEARLAEAAKDMAALKLEENGTYKTKGT